MYKASKRSAKGRQRAEKESILKTFPPEARSGLGGTPIAVVDGLRLVEQHAALHRSRDAEPIAADENGLGRHGRGAARKGMLAVLEARPRRQLSDVGAGRAVNQPGNADPEGRAAAHAARFAGAVQV